MHDLYYVKSKIKAGWNKRIQIMKIELVRSNRVLESLKRREFPKQSVKKGAISRQSRRVHNIKMWIKEMENRINAL